jgi:hypothetical protein
MLKVYLAIIAAVEVFNLALLPWVLPGSPLWLLIAEAVGVLLLTVLVVFLVRRKIATAYRRGQLSPEKLVNRRSSEEDHYSSPEELSRSIVERAEEIRRALDVSPSKVEAEMCALGYRACVNDMITLTNTINEQAPAASPLRRFRLHRAKKRSTEALSRAREALPEDALRATRQEQQP